MRVIKLKAAQELAEDESTENKLVGVTERMLWAFWELEHDEGDHLSSQAPTASEATPAPLPPPK